MSLAVSFSSFWGWVTGIFRRKEKRRQVSRTLQLHGSMKTIVTHGLEMFGVVLFHVEKGVDIVGENFSLLTLDLLMEEDD